MILFVGHLWNVGCMITLITISCICSGSLFNMNHPNVLKIGIICSFFWGSFVWKLLNLDEDIKISRKELSNIRTLKKPLSWSVSFKYRRHFWSPWVYYCQNNVMLNLVEQSSYPNRSQAQNRVAVVNDFQFIRSSW